MLKGLLIVVALAATFIFLIAYYPPEPVAPDYPEPPCEELMWMRDSPQARCVEYWKERNMKENADAEFYAQ